MILEEGQDAVQEVLELEQELVLLRVLVVEELFVVSLGLILELEVVVQKVLELVLEVVGQEVLELEKVVWVGLGVNLQLGVLCEVVEILLQTSA